jgi:predicted ribosomally synthesized peptide with SipW-like signal peptide
MGHRRRLLVVTAIVGLLAAAVGSGTTLAAFTDTATTGASGDVNDLDHLETAPVDIAVNAADITIARYPVDPACGAFRDDLLLSILQVEAVEPGATGLASDFGNGICVRNDGTEPVSVTLRASDITSWEVTCEAAEGAVDPQGATCGDLGEAAPYVEYLGVVLDTVTDPNACPLNPVVDGPYVPLAQPMEAFSLDPGEIACVGLDLGYRPADAEAAVIAQTDRARWRWTIDSTT